MNACESKGPAGTPAAFHLIFAGMVGLAGLLLAASPSRAANPAPGLAVPAAPTMVTPAPSARPVPQPALDAPTPAAPVSARPQAVAPPAKLTPAPAKPATPAAAAPAVTAPAATKPISRPAAAPPEVKPANHAAAAPPSVPARILPHELSPWGMFLHADIVVKIVMVGLIFASIITWTVWLAKSLELFSARRRAVRQLSLLAGEESLAAAQAGFADAKGPVAQMVAATAGELQRSASLSHEGIKERAAALVARIEARAGRQMNRGTGALATIGATAPFIGLFGTVWGIMDAFIGISKTDTTNLAVVAPGIAEALLTTAIGLVAAIPAVMIYNIFARSIASYRAALGDAAAEILRHLSRDLDRATMEAAEEEGDWRVLGMRQSAE